MSVRQIKYLSLLGMLFNLPSMAMEPMRGDMNNDQRVEISDVVGVINIVLGDGVATQGADCDNSGGAVIVSDVVCTINVALADNVDELVSFTEQQRLIADQFISIFENSTKTIQYDYAENIGDNRGITAGRAGFTSATADMRELILDYTEINPNNLLIQYVDELERLSTIRYTPPRSEAKDILSANTDNLPNLILNWKTTAERQDFRNAQDAYVDTHYFNRALEKAQGIGATLPLTLLSLYDTSIQHGDGDPIVAPTALTALVHKATEMTGNQTPAEGANEVEWLMNFITNRKNMMLADEFWRHSLARIDELQDLIAAENYQLEPFTLCIQRYSCVLGQGSEDEYDLP
jgi:chitosanase